MQLARSVLLTYVDFTVVLPGKILFGICFSAANCCVTDLEDKAGDDHDQNGDISQPSQLQALLLILLNPLILLLNQLLLLHFEIFFMLFLHPIIRMPSLHC